MTQAAWAVAAWILLRPHCFHFSQTHSTPAMHACSGARCLKAESCADVAGHWRAPTEGTAV